MREVRDETGGFTDVYDHVSFFVPEEEKIVDLTLTNFTQGSANVDGRNDIIFKIQQGQGIDDSLPYLYNGSFNLSNKDTDILELSSNDVFINGDYSTGTTDHTYYVRLYGDAFSNPHYIFSETPGGAEINKTNNKLTVVRGHSYTFIRTDGGHPFNVGDAHNTNATGISVTSTGSGGDVNGANSIVSGEQLSFTVPGDYSGILKYYCYSHSSMIHDFDIQDTGGNHYSILFYNNHADTEIPIFYKLEATIVEYSPEPQPEPEPNLKPNPNRSRT